MPRTKEIYLARDEDGELFAFRTEPILSEETGIWDVESGDEICLGYDMFQTKVTFGNSPIKATVEAYHDALAESDITIVEEV